MRPRLPHARWRIAATLASTSFVSYGVLAYAFATVLPLMERDLGWSRATLSAGYSLALGVAGVAQLPIGRAIDRGLGRKVTTLGCLAAATLVGGWALCESVLAYFLVWLGLGVCMAALFYEPAFAIVSGNYVEGRERALLLVTLGGSLAGPIFVPLVSAFAASLGWRQAVLLAAALLLLTAPAFLLGLRDLRSHPPPANRGRTRPAIRRSERLSSLAWSAPALAGSAMTVHGLPLVLEAGASPAEATAAFATFGLVKLPGRLIYAWAAHRWSPFSTAPAVLAIQGLALLPLLWGTGAAGAWFFVVAFGAADGAATTARASSIAASAGAARAGAAGGVVAVPAGIARACAPAGVGLLHTAAGSYGPALVVLFVLLLAGSWALRARAAAACVLFEVAPSTRMHHERRRWFR